MFLTTAEATATAYFAPAVRMFLVACFVLISLGRLYWFATCFAAVYGRGKREAVATPVRWAVRSTTAQVFQREALSPEQERARQVGFVAASIRESEFSLLIGSLALAGWTQLFAAADQIPGRNLSPVSRNLLLTASIVLIVGYAVFRTHGRTMNLIGQDCVVAIGLSALALSLASIVLDLFGSVGGFVAALLGLLLTAREVSHWRDIAVLRKQID